MFSARDWPGAWYPYGVPQRIFRTAPECEGCYLEVCVDRGNACLIAISVEEVLAGCEQIMTKGPRMLHWKMNNHTSSLTTTR